MHVLQVAPGLWRWSSPHPAWTPRDDSPTGWPREVGSVYFEPAEGRGVVLVDPLVPSDEAERLRFWRALDRDVERRGGEVVVVVANAWHGRSAREILARYGPAPRCRVVAHAEAEAHVQADLTDTVSGDEAGLPGGLRAVRLSPADGGEIAVVLPGDAGVAFADALLGVGGGEVRTPSRNWGDQPVPPRSVGAALPRAPPPATRPCRVQVDSCPTVPLGHGPLPTTWGPEAERPTFQERLRARLRTLLPVASRLLVSHGEPVLENGREALERALSAPPKGA